MKKFAIFGLLVLCAGLLMAAAVKFNLTPYEGDGAAIAGSYGQAVLNYAKGTDKTEIQVNCWGLNAGEEYIVYYGNPGYLPVGNFVAKKNGAGNFHAWVTGDVSTSTNVAVNTLANKTVLLNQ